MYTPSVPTQITPPHPDTDEGADFWHPRQAAGSSHTLRDHGGPKLVGPELFLLLYGDFSQFDKRILDFASDLMRKGYLSPLSAYGMTGTPDYLGAATVPQNYGQSLSQAVCYAIISGAIADGVAPANHGQTIYALLLPSGVSVQALGGSNCQTFCGFHSSGNGMAYAVIPDTACTPCHGPNTPFDALCMVLAHEVAESITDPTGEGWYEDSTGDENADLCAWQTVTYGPWTVQPYWTNEAQCTYGQYESAPPPPPPPGPPPPSTDLEARVAALEEKQGVQSDTIAVILQTQQHIVDTLAKVKEAFG